MIAVLMLVTAQWAGAHGVNVEFVMHGEIVAVRSSFSPTQPLVDAMVSIYSPAAVENVWQSGKTDKNGYFLFKPDTEGEWIFVVDDQKGHMKRLAVNVQAGVSANEEDAPGESLAATATAHGGMSRTAGIITGLSIIFGITGIFYGLRAKKAADSK